MKIYPDKLASQVQGALSPLYIVSGEETLLINEAADTIRQAARQQGFTEREIFHADTVGFSWDDTLQSLNSLSLFAEKKLVEIRCAKKHLNNKDFIAYWQHANPDTVVLIITDKIDKGGQNTKWFKTLEKAAVFIAIWPLDNTQLHRWLTQSAQQQGLVIDSPAITVLQERVEGNLLAASQELEKLHLLYGNKAINADTLHESVADSARYDVFKLTDDVLQGNQIRSLNILQHLLEEGSSEFLILRTLTREIRLLGNLKTALDKGQSSQNVFQKNGIWQKRQPAYQSALKRLSQKKIHKLLQQAQQLDLAVMGLKNKNVADGLQRLCLNLSRG